MCAFLPDLHQFLAPSVEFVLHSDTARLPEQSTQCAAGFDLYADDECVVEPWTSKMVATNVQVNLDRNRHIYARIAPRSGLALNRNVFVNGGVVDADYEGLIGVILFNASSEPLHVTREMRIAQLIVERIALPRVSAVSTAHRGAGGFGSTGGS